MRWHPQQRVNFAVLVFFVLNENSTGLRMNICLGEHAPR
jgi:hypothetical protein